MLKRSLLIFLLLLSITMINAQTFERDYKLPFYDGSLDFFTMRQFNIPHIQ